MLTRREFLLRATLATLIASAGIFTAVRLATATPGGPTRDALTYAGVLRERAGMMTTLTFVFRKGAATACAVTTGAFMVGASGAFSVEVPLNRCTGSRGLFDGDDVVYDVRLDGETGERVASNVAVTPVPYARFADQVGVNNDCPVGYMRRVDPGTPAMTLCVRTLTLGATSVTDEVVKVGTGASAFWVDRYEASVWGPSGTQQLGGSPGSFPNLAPNGQWAEGARGILRAYAYAGVPPSRSVTWFQARSLCRAAGKRLINRDEWFEAADGLGSIDPATEVNGNTGGETRCNTGGIGPRHTGSGSGCASSWGAQDMIGNLWEWTDEWYASVGGTSWVNIDAVAWPTGYNDDRTSNIAGGAGIGPSQFAIGAPGAAVRGGYWEYGSRAGVYSLSLNYGPAHTDPRFGFRCVVPR